MDRALDQKKDNRAKKNVVDLIKNMGSNASGGGGQGGAKKRQLEAEKIVDDKNKKRKQGLDSAVQFSSARPCYFWLQGSCAKGQDCSFNHDPASISKEEVALAKRQRKRIAPEIKNLLIEAGKWE